MNTETLYLLGTQLTQAQQSYVKSAYVHRYTREHKPPLANRTWKDGKPFPVQFDSDADWLAHTRFAVTKQGSLHLRLTDCQSCPTWPDNPELRT